VGYTEKVVVIGAGISGLACAFRLQQLGLQPVVFEAAKRAGGVIETVRRNGFLFEGGPQCPRFPEPLWQLVGDLGLRNEFVAGDPKAKRYILRDGRLHLAPLTPGGLIRTGVVDTRSKLRIFTDLLRHTTPPQQEESLAEFVERNFGEEILDYLVDPFISTIFVADPRKMGMESAFPQLVEWERNHGSLLRGALAARKSRQNNAKRHDASDPAKKKAATLRVTDSLPSLGSFKAGMATLTEKLALQLKENIRYGEAAESITPMSSDNIGTDGGWSIQLSDGTQVAAEFLVLAVPAYVAARLLERSAPQLASLLNAIEYSPVCVVSAVYDSSNFPGPLDGFGFMVPKKEGKETICTFWNSSLFEGRAANGKTLITTFAGRGACSRLFTSSDEECARIIESENARVLEINGPSIDRVVWRNPRALPQYNVGHARRVAQIADALRDLPNLHIAGNYLTGRSIGDCVQIAFRVADDLHSRYQR
jgi:protoporphyrinogen/coproporphyrinogen III oxidase